MHTPTLVKMFALAQALSSHFSHHRKRIPRCVREFRGVSARPWRRELFSRLNARNGAATGVHANWCHKTCMTQDMCVDMQNLKTNEDMSIQPRFAETGLFQLTIIAENLYIMCLYMKVKRTGEKGQRTSRNRNSTCIAHPLKVPAPHS